MLGGAAIEKICLAAIRSTNINRNKIIIIRSFSETWARSLLHCVYSDLLRKLIRGYLYNEDYQLHCKSLSIVKNQMTEAWF